MTVVETVAAQLSHVPQFLYKAVLWAVVGYPAFFFLSPFIAATIVHVAYLVAGTRPGGTAAPNMRKVAGFNSERDREEMEKRNIDPERPLIRKIAKESVSYASGLTAVLLQIAHPAVGKGVGRHSNFSTRLVERTLNTAFYINVMIFGTDAEKTAFRNFVTLAHQYVNDKRTKNTYDALDPDLQLWVAATMYATMIDCYENAFGRLSDAESDQAYQEFSIFGTALQVPLSKWPENRAAFQQYWDQEIEKLDVPQEAIRTAQDLFHPQYSKLPVGLRPLLFFKVPLDVVTATEELPEHVRHAFGLKSTPWTRFLHSTLTTINALTYRYYPEWARTWQKDYYMWMMRQRFANKGMMRNGKSIALQSLEA